MTSQIGYIDIPSAEMRKYRKAARRKAGVCDVVPRGRFSIRSDGQIRFNGLVCSSADMCGKATGIGAESCNNCILET